MPLYLVDWVRGFRYARTQKPYHRAFDGKRGVLIQTVANDVPTDVFAGFFYLANTFVARGGQRFRFLVLDKSAVENPVILTFANVKYLAASRVYEAVHVEFQFVADFLRKYSSVVGCHNTILLSVFSLY
jgi:hypothetical protein